MTQDHPDRKPARLFTTYRELLLDYGTDALVVHVSTWSGRVDVFHGDRLVARDRSWSPRHRIPFVLEGRSLEVEITLARVLPPIVRARLLDGREVIGEDHWQARGRIAKTAIAICLGAGFLSGFLAVWFSQ